MPAPVSSQLGNTLGVHIIVRDAERTIGALLRTVLAVSPDGVPVFDEVVLVDTGSVDSTRRLIEAAVHCLQVDRTGALLQAQWVQDGPAMAAQAKRIIEGIADLGLDRRDAAETFKVLLLGTAEGHLIREVKARWPNAQITTVDRAPPRAPAEVLEGVTVVTQQAEDFLRETCARGDFFHLGISDLATEFGPDWRLYHSEASDDDKLMQLHELFAAVCKVALVANGEDDEDGPAVLPFPPQGLRLSLAQFPPASQLCPARFVLPVGRGYYVRVVLARFVWVDDFSAARNYSFNLGTCRFRAYLDADDTMPHVGAIRRHVEGVRRQNPTANVFCFSYDYSADVFQQDVERVFEWCGPDGAPQFQWQWALHEHVEPTGLVRKHKVLSPTDGSLTVVHARDDRGAARSLDRNFRMLRKLYAEAPAGDARTRWAFFLGEGLLWTEQPGARELLLEAAARVDLFACYALCALAKHALLQAKNTTEGLEFAASAAGRFPEQKMPLALLAIGHNMRGDAARATHAYGLFKAAGATNNETNLNDRLVTEVVLPLAMARIYFTSGDMDATRTHLDGVHRDAVRGSPYETAFLRLVSEFERERTAALYMMGARAALVAADPMVARSMLANPPPAIARVPKVRAMAAQVRAKTDFALYGWERYGAAYAAAEAPHIEDETQQQARISAMHRTRMLLKRVEQLAKQRPEGEIRAISIGPYAAMMEKMAYDLCPRLRWTFVTPTADSVATIGKVFGDAPHRVRQARDFFDWADADVFGEPEETFDLVIMFEVMEHLPFERPEVIDNLKGLLAPGGTLMVSVPNPEMMCEGYLGEAANPQIPFYAHIAPNTVSDLWRNFREADLNINIMSGDADRALTVIATRGAAPNAKLPRVVIRAYGPIRFDALTLHETALGGSEEAVVHLSHALAAMGHEVVVHAPLPQRDAVDATSFRVSGNVLWLEVSEFMPDDVRPQDVLFVWRDPVFAAKARAALGPGGKIVNWLHDTNYSVQPQVYGEVDATIVLSPFHVDTLRLGDGYLPAEHGGRIDVLANGVDVAALPLTQEQGGSIQREAHRVIYASSPDRGLETLIDIWPAVRAQVPDAELHIYYGWATFDVLVSRDPVKNAALMAWAAGLKAKIASLAESGVVYHGGVSHGELHRAFAAAGVWAYPTTFPEIHCITAAKAQCLGAWPVVTTTGALVTTVCCDGIVLSNLGEALLPFYSDVMRVQAPAANAPEEAHKQYAELVAQKERALELYTAALISALQDPPSAEVRLSMINTARETFGWADVAEGFSEVACRVAQTVRAK